MSWRDENLAYHPDDANVLVWFAEAYKAFLASVSPRSAPPADESPTDRLNRLLPPLNDGELPPGWNR